LLRTKVVFICQLLWKLKYGTFTGAPMLYTFSLEGEIKKGEVPKKKNPHRREKFLE
jgi:hypothetical protein